MRNAERNSELAHLVTELKNGNKSAFNEIYMLSACPMKSRDDCIGFIFFLADEGPENMPEKTVKDVLTINICEKVMNFT